MILLAGLLAIAGLAAGVNAACCQTDKAVGGLPNFGHVTGTLFRGGQPSATGFSTLRAMGVEIVVNFRDEPAEITGEERLVKSLGMKYVGIPWNGHNKPSGAQIVQFLDLIRANPQAKIFVHCKLGADRTGVMVAAYRIAVEHKSAAEAVSEMRQFHYDWFWLPQLERYVNSFPGLLQKDPRFSAYASVPSPVAAETATLAPVYSPNVGP